MVKCFGESHLFHVPTEATDVFIYTETRICIFDVNVHLTDVVPLKCTHVSGFQHIIAETPKLLTKKSLPQIDCIDGAYLGYGTL